MRQTSRYEVREEEEEEEEEEGATAQGNGTYQQASAICWRTAPLPEQHTRLCPSRWRQRLMF